MSLPEGSLSASHATRVDHPPRARRLNVAVLALLLAAVGSGGFYTARLMRRNEVAAPASTTAVVSPVAQPPQPSASAAAEADVDVSKQDAALPPEPNGVAPAPPKAQPSAVLQRPVQRSRPSSAARPRKKKVEDTLPVNPYR